MRSSIAGRDSASAGRSVILIAGGGTGGHVFPMIAVGDAVRAIEPSARVVYVGTPRGIEARVMGERGDELVLMDVAPLRGGGLAGFFRGALRAVGSIPEARSIVARIAPDAALSVGGYAGGPVALAARLASVPVALLEPNSVMGLSNRLLAPFVERAFIAFPETERFLRPSVVRRTGVPLRRAFEPSPYAPNAGRVRLLVLGGSLGAKALNETVPEAIAIAIARGADVEVTHQTGRDRDEDVRARYASIGLADRVTVSPFINDVAQELTRADVVLQRSGASAVSELTAIGRASILVPYPFAADDHQLKNARSLAASGAAIAVPQKEATAERLAASIVDLASSPARRLAMADAARALGKPEAAREIARELLTLSQRRAGHAPAVTLGEAF